MSRTFIDPAIFQEMQAVFNLPMTANIAQQIGRRYLIRVKTGDVVTHIVRDDLAVGRAQLTIHAQRNLAARQIQRLANVVRVI